ncbi:MAG: TetR/AcrR family transcriptional regulator [Bacteroidota bacterium]
MSEAKRPRGRPKTTNPERIVEQAMLDYWRDGIHTRSINQLCKQLGMSKPAFYREFGGEDGLMVAALKHYRQLRLVPLLAMLQADRPFASVLPEVIAWMTAEQDTPNGCLFTKLRLLRDELGPQTAAHVRAIEAELLNALDVWCRQGLAQGAVHPDIAPAFAAQYIGGQLTMALVQRALQVPSEVVEAQVSIALKALRAHA